MKKLTFKSILILSLLSFSYTFACGTCGCRAPKKDKHKHSENAVTNNIYSQKSSVKWKATKVGGEHEGDITIRSGHLHFEDEKLVSGQVEIDMQSINCTDLSGSYKDKLEDHLNSSDFFDTEKHPVSSIDLLSCKYVGNNKYKIKAEMTIKDITKDIEFEAILKDGKANAKVVIDRSEFDVRYGSGSFFSDLGDNLIYDDFELVINMVY